MKSIVRWLTVLCILCGCHNQNTDSTETSNASLSASEETVHRSGMPIAIDPVLITSVDQQLQTLRKKLPYKQNDKELISASRHNQYIYYHYLVMNQQDTSKTFKAGKAREQLLENCRHNITRRILTGGFKFVYIYTFYNHSQVSVQLTAADCHP